MEVDVSYAEWHVGDGDAEIRVGSRWSPTLLLAPIYAVPYVSQVFAAPVVTLSSAHDRMPGLRALDGEPAGCEFVADTVRLGGDPGAPCSVLEASGVRFIVEEESRGRVSGEGRLTHDSYRIEDEHLLNAAAHDFAVTRVRYVEQVSRDLGGGDFLIEGYKPPVDVSTTYATRSGAVPPSADFLITIDGSTARPLPVRDGTTRGRRRARRLRDALRLWRS